MPTMTPYKHMQENDNVSIVFHFHMQEEDAEEDA